LRVRAAGRFVEWPRRTADSLWPSTSRSRPRNVAALRAQTKSDRSGAEAERDQARPSGSSRPVRLARLGARAHALHRPL